MMKRVALVTGASSGLGKATAALLAESGYKVYGTTRADTPSNSEGVRMLSLELASQASVDACVRQVVDDAGQIDLVVNNAGFPMAGAIEETSIEEIDHEFQVNFFGTLRVIKTVTPILRGQRSGTIINISSAAAFIPVPFYGIYGASKAALERLSFSLRQELKPVGVHVSVISPSSHRTEVKWAVPSAPLSAYDGARDRVLAAMQQTVVEGGDPGKVARAVLDAASARAPRARYLVGSDSKAFGILQRIAPHSLIERMISAKFRLSAAATKLAVASEAARLPPAGT